MTHTRPSFALVAVTAVAAGALVGCADEPTRPTETPTPNAEAYQSLGLSTEERAQLRGALLFAREHSLLALERREAADRVASAFAALAERAEQDDRVGLERAVGAARAAIAGYRELGGPDDASGVDVEAMMLTLDHAAALAREADTARGQATSRTDIHTSCKERQP